MANSSVRPDSDPAWDDLLRQLRHRPAAQPRPFFYSRVQARLVAKASADKNLLPGWLRRPAYAALLGALVFSLSGDGSGSTTPNHPLPQQQQLQR
ncbi:hypothetical protein [Hymenobacter arizonensis]|uniref:Uncharacterized protein n=1 Tax=Hymenobacter arizonensis TaxID=1227077 RepID=A0A1I5ZXN0_HYMAR|nr:hypothetical protein [Hymenobacter arizonensis]SFQ61226.1 hypothetical protein SAMN04515668_3294 [Hymenobacter arizonensis]